MSHLGCQARLRADHPQPYRLLSRQPLRWFRPDADPLPGFGRRQRGRKPHDLVAGHALLLDQLRLRRDLRQHADAHLDHHVLRRGSRLRSLRRDGAADARHERRGGHHRHRPQLPSVRRQHHHQLLPVHAGRMDEELRRGRHIRRAGGVLHQLRAGRPGGRHRRRCYGQYS
jgi:hypothetical protein